MFAIIKIGGKQYRVSPGDRLDVERLEPFKGQEVRFNDVLLIVDKKGVAVGQPVVEKAVVLGELEGEKKGKKLYPLKKKRRKNYRRRIGHRQLMSIVKINEIKLGARPKEPGAETEKTTKSQKPGK